MLLGEDDAGRKAALDVLRRVLAARGEMSGESARRLARVEELFGVRLAKAVKAETAHV
jgi:hypothetical protein